MTTAATEVKERPILFSGPMVRAILDGRKTQTRRVIKPQPDFIRKSPFVPGGLEDDHGYGIKIKYEPGDRLWVRETWAAISPDDSEDHSIDDCTIEYRADTDNPLPNNWPLEDKDDPACGRWRPSIHLPRRFSRIALEITGVRVERVQDISEADALAEGIIKATKDGNLYKYGLENWPWRDWHLNYFDAWNQLWESVHGPDAWQKNQWCWVVEFKRIRP